MSDKLVWSTFQTAVELGRLSPEELRAELVDYGFDADMLGDMTGEELNALLNDDVFWQIDLEDFDYNVLPMINKQTEDGIVLMVGHEGGMAATAEMLKGGDIDPDVYDVEILDDGEGLVWVGHYSDGSRKYDLYSIPEDHTKFINECMTEAISDELMYSNHTPEDDEDEVADEIHDVIESHLLDLDYLNDYVDFLKVPEVCKRIKNEYVYESLNESEDDVVTIVVDAVIDPYLYKENMDAIREFNIEPEYDINKAYDNLTLTGTKANLVRYLKSDLYGETDEWIKEFYPILLENLNESNGNYYTFVRDYGNGFWSASDWGMTEEEFESEVLDYEGKRCQILSTEVDVGDDFESDYYNIRFDDGHELDGVSGLHLKRVDESLNEASSKEQKKLKKELKEIKSLVKEYGKEYLTSMPFTSYDNDPISIEYQYPEFFKIVKSFFKEMELLDKEQLNNNELLDDSWDSDIDDHDWDVLMTVCDKLVNRPGVPVQIEKIYKTGYNSFLDDDQILADREGNPDLQLESLNEEFIDVKRFSLKDLENLKDSNVVFNKNVMYSNLNNYDEDEMPDFDRLGFEIKKNGDVIIPKGYIATIKGVSSYEGYNPEIYLESNGEEFVIALGWVKPNEMSVINSSES